MALVSRSLTFTLVLMASASSGRAQSCLDWVDGFGNPGHGVIGEIRSLLPYDDGSGLGLFAGGGFRFTSSGEVTRVAKWNGLTWQPIATTWNSNVREMIPFDDGTGTQLYVGGDFSLIGAVPAGRVARWNGTAWNPVGVGMNGSVNALALYDAGSGPRLYAAGGFTTADGNPVARIAMWDGSNWNALGSGINGEVLDLAVYDSGSGPLLYACGYFNQAGGVSTGGIAQWNGTAWSGLGALSGVGQAECLAVHDDGGGSRLFISATGLGSLGWMAKWNGSALEGLSAPAPELATSMAVVDDGSGSKLFIGGNIWLPGDASASHVAKWNGVSWSGLTTGLSGLSGRPYGFAPFDDGTGLKLYVGGDFLTAGSKPASKFACYGAPCTLPTFLEQPSSQTAYLGPPLEFRVRTGGLYPQNFLWLHNSVPIPEGGGMVGTTTNTLAIWQWSYSDAGDYQCQVTNAIGSVVSAPALLTVPAGGVTGVPFTLEPIVLPPQPVPNRPGLFFTSVGGAVQAADGTNAFYCGVTGGEAMGLFENGAPSVLATTQDPVPGLPPSFGYSSFAGSNYHAARDGRVVFSVRLSGPGVDASNRLAILYRDASAVSLVVRDGDPVPGGAPGDTYYQLSGWASMDLAGHVLIQAGVRNAGVYAYKGLWLWNATTGATLLARTGDIAPSTTAHFTDLSWMSRLDEQGNVLVLGRLDTDTGYDFTSYSDNGLWYGPPGALQLVLKSGDTPAGIPSGTNIGQIWESHPLVSGTGHVVFQCAIDGPGYSQFATYIWLDGSLTSVARGLDPAPGAPGDSVLTFPSPMYVTSSGTVLFKSGINNSCYPTCPTRGAWWWDGTLSHPVVFDASDPLPGMAPAARFVEVLVGSANDAGQVALTLRFEPGNYYPSAAFGWSSQTGLFPIAEPGTQIEVAPGDFRTVQGGEIATYDGGASGPSEGSAMDGEGVVSLYISFTNFTRGLFRGRFASFAGLFAPCPIVYTPEHSQTALYGEPVLFHPLVSYLEPATVSWHRDGIALTDGGTISGSQTPTLSISAAQAIDTGDYELFISNSCGSLWTSPVRLDVGPGQPFCMGDGTSIPCPCGNFSAPHAFEGCRHSLGTGGRLFADGIASLTSDTLVLRGSHMPNSTALYFQGTQQVNAGDGAHFGDGLRCAGGSILRIGTKVNTAGTSSYPGPGDATVSVRGSITSPTVRHYQVWYRNAASFCTAATFNVSNGLTIEWGM